MLFAICSLFSILKAFNHALPSITILTPLLSAICHSLASPPYPRPLNLIGFPILPEFPFEGFDELS